MAWIFPSMPRSPKPPGTRMPSSPAMWPASPSRSMRSAATHTTSAAGQRLVESLVGVLHLDVLAHHSQAAAAARRLHPAHDLLPAGKIDRPCRQPEQLDSA